MDIETGKWWACDYEIEEITPDIEQFHLRHLRVVSAKKESPVRFYNPLTYEGGIKREEVGKKSYQPEKADIGGYPPHIELARLNTANIADILKFTSTYGLLGLWFTRDAIAELQDGYYHKLACSMKLIKSIPRDDLEHGGGWREFFEPLDSFIAAAKMFQSACYYLKAIKEKKKGRYEAELWRNFKEIAEPYLQEIQPRIGRDINTGLPTIVWDFKNLINCCYFRLIQDVQGNMLKNCGLRKCGKPFLARNKEDNYCSKECRRKGTMANLAIRQVKNELRDMEERGEIDKPIRWLAGSKAQGWYEEGVNKYQELLSKTIKFIEKEKLKGGLS